MATSLTKPEARQRMREVRRLQSNKESLSDTICERLRSHAAFGTAKVVMVYIHARSEVRTDTLVQELLASSRTVAIPFCEGDELIPWQLVTRNELAVGAFGILEPKNELRELPTRQVDPAAIDLIVVPGLAFDRWGNRLGSGRGYYDRLLPRLRPDAIKIGLAYECQIVADLATQAHDVPMDFVITEASCIDAR